MVADLLSPKYFGVFGSFPSRCLCTIAIPAAISGRVARPLRLRLSDPEPCGRTFAAIRGQGGHLPTARHFGGDSIHALARHQRRKAASAERHSLIVGG